MNMIAVTAIAGFLGTTLTLSNQAQAAAAEPATTTIDIAGHPVPVQAGGLYDRYRSNPPLAVIAQEDPGVDLSWFRTLEKQQVDIGFASYSPNFYYRNSSITAVFTADIARLRALIPAAVGKAVQPIQVWPGRGVVALTAYAYHYCDNDRYNEISLSIVTSEPGKSSFGSLSLIGQSASRSFWGYVLKLPVNTELARVRGVVGYQLPKWLADIRLREEEKSISFDMIDSETGKTDIVFSGAKLRDVSDETRMVTNSFTNADGAGRLSYGYAVSRQLRHGSTRDADAVTLTLGEGKLSDTIRSLKLGKMLRYEYVPEFQSALYAPRPLAALGAPGRKAAVPEAATPR